MIDASTGWYFDHVSVKGVVLDGDSVLLGRNPRDEWELPGGWPTLDDAALEHTLARELLDETGVRISNPTLIATELFQVTPAQRVVIVTFLARASSLAVAIGDEHSAVDFFPVRALPEALPELYRRHIRMGVERTASEEQG